MPVIKMNRTYKIDHDKVEKILKGSLDSIPSPSTSEIQIVFTILNLKVPPIKCDLVTGRLREQPVVSFLGKTVVISVSPLINVFITKVISK